MADVSQTLALLVLAQNYRGEIVSQINRRSALLRTLRLVPGEGQNVAWVAKGSGQIAENYTEGADAANFGSDAQKQALLSWGHYRSNFHVTGTAMRTARTSRTPLGVQNLIGRNMFDAVETLTSTINVALHTGAGTGTTIAGLGVAIGSTVNTYATVDRTVSTYWQPTVSDPGAATPLTMAQVRGDLSTIYDASGEFPDLAFVNSTVFNIVAGLFDPTRRYIQATQTISTARGSVTLDAGYQALEIDGCMFLRDKDAAAGTINYINSRRCYIEYLPLEDEMLAALASLGMDLSANDGYGPIPLGMRAQKLAKEGDSERYQVLTNLQLVVERPNSCGQRLNVA